MKEGGGEWRSKVKRGRWMRGRRREGLEGRWISKERQMDEVQERLRELDG